MNETPASNSSRLLAGMVQDACVLLMSPTSATACVKPKIKCSAGCGRYHKRQASIVGDTPNDEPSTTSDR